MRPPSFPSPVKMKDMAMVCLARGSAKRFLPLAVLLASLTLFSACKQAPQPDAGHIDETDMWLNNVPALRPFNVSNAEIDQLEKAHEAGLSDLSCVALIKLARSRKVPFKDGEAVANLLAAGSSEQTVLELDRLNQLGLWAGEAQILRLAGLSDNVILAVAQRRSKGLPVISETKLGELKNAGASDATILDFVQKGFTDQEASEYIAQRERAAGGHGFVYQGHRNKS